MNPFSKPIRSLITAFTIGIALLWLFMAIVSVHAAEARVSDSPRLSNKVDAFIKAPNPLLAPSSTCFARVSDGISDSPVYTSVQTAIDAVTTTSDTVKVAGYCNEAEETDINFFQIAFINQPLTLRGGYTTTNWTVSDPIAYPTIFDGGDTDRVMVISGTNDVQIENLTLMNGYNSDFPGGGLYAVGAEAILVNTNIYSNSSAGGGGIYLESGQLTLSGVEMRGNSTFNEGGAVYNEGQLSVTDGSLIHVSSADFGGGIYNDGQLSIASDSVVFDNSADRGGGIYNRPGAFIEIDDSLISDNTASINLGGGIYNDGQLEITNSTVDINRAKTNGGGIANSSSGVLTMTNSTVSYNQADDSGAGIFSEGNFYLLNSTLSSNNALGNGGGLHAGSYAAGTLEFTTVASNTAMAGSALYLELGTLELYNTLIAKNDISPNCNGSITSNGYNLADDTSCDLIATGDIVTATPGIKPLQLNAPGETKTHALSDTSPAIDAGQCVLGIFTDQRGAPRPIFDMFSCDIGAYEVEAMVDAEIIVYSPSEISVVAEGGLTDTLEVLLSSEPTAEVTVDLTTDGQTTVAPTSLSFDSTNWDTSQLVVVTAVQDTIVEGTHSGDINFIATSLDADYNGLTTSFTTDIEDDDFSADLAVVKTAPAAAVLGDTIAYNIQVSNNGPNDATNLTIIDTLPDVGTQVATELISPNSLRQQQVGAQAISCSQSGQVFSCTVTELQAGAVMNLDLELTPQANGTFVNNVQVQADTSDPDTSNNSDTATTIVGEAVADLALSKTVSPASVTVGETLTYTLEVVNNGPNAVFGVTVIDPLPSELLIASASTSQGNCNISGGTVSCGIGTMVDQAAVQITIVATSATGFADVRDLSNTATATATIGTDSAPANNTATAAVTIVPLIIDNIISPSLGGTISYTDVLNNRTEIIVPAGAVTTDIKLAFSPISVSVAPPTGLEDTGNGFSLEAFTHPAGQPLSNFTFLKPITLTIEYDDSDITEIEDENELRVYYFDGSAWRDVAESCSPVSNYQRDVANNSLTINICHLTEFGLFGPGSGSITYLPIIVK